jgi:hypothetical protein
MRNVPLKKQNKQLNERKKRMQMLKYAQPNKRLKMRNYDYWVNKQLLPKPNLRPYEVSSSIHHWMK